jgi:hypothetical protein
MRAKNCSEAGVDLAIRQPGFQTVRLHYILYYWRQVNKSFKKYA